MRPVEGVDDKLAACRNGLFALRETLLYGFIAVLPAVAAAFHLSLTRLA